MKKLPIKLKIIFWYLNRYNRKTGSRLEITVKERFG